MRSRGGHPCQSPTSIHSLMVDAPSKRLVRCGLNAWLADFNSFGEMPSGPVALLDFICLVCHRTLSSVNLTSESDCTPLDCSSESEDNNGMIKGESSHASFSPTAQSGCSSSKLYGRPLQLGDQTSVFNGSTTVCCFAAVAFFTKFQYALVVFISQNKFP